MQVKIKAMAAAVLAAVAMAVVPAARVEAATLPPGVVHSGNGYVQLQNPCNCIVTIDGYLFGGLSYVEAATLWMDLYDDPGYVSLPPITSITLPVIVSGTVNPPDPPPDDPPADDELGDDGGPPPR